MCDPLDDQPKARVELTPKLAYERAGDSVGRVETDKETGIGFFERDGRTVVTCFHVEEGAP